MKNLYFLAAVAAFALGSCTVEEALDPPAGPDDEAKAIEFGTFLDRVPQNGIKPLATVMTITQLRNRNPGFMVEAYTSGTTSWNDWTDGARTVTPNFMSAQTVTWGIGGSSWKYSPIQYWPVSNSNWDKVSFFAYLSFASTSPGTTFTPAEAADKNPKLYCTMPSDFASQVDLIVDARYNVRGNDDNGKVKFEFDHVLSQIGFKAKTSYAPATVTMSSLMFYYGGLKRSGTYEFNSGTEPDSGDKNNKAENSWDVTDGTPGGYSNSIITSNIVIPSGTTPFDISEYRSPPARYLMLIPQENPENIANQAYVTVSYTIRFPSGSGQSLVTVLNKEVYLPPIIWKPGKAYTYTLDIVAPKEMIFHVSEGDDWSVWEDVDPPIAPIDVP